MKWLALMAIPLLLIALHPQPKATPPHFGAISSALAVNDDGMETTANAVTLTNSTDTHGSGSGQANYLAFRFTSVAVPNAATIRHAYLKLGLASVKTTAASIVIHGEAADNSGVLTTGGSNISGRSQTTAATTMRVDDLGDADYYFDVTSSVQEIVNRAAWASGNALTLIAGPASATAIAVSSMVESANDPTLQIIYGDSASNVLPPTASGVNDYTNPNNAFASDDTYATTDNSQTGSQTWGTFGITGVTGTVTGILVKVEGKVTSGASNAQYSVDLSWDGGTTWTTAKTSNKLDTNDVSISFGGASGWSHTFIPADLTDALFKVRVTNSFASATEDSRIDFVTAQVFYTPSARYQIMQLSEF